jgi:membrane-bound lytic murein transglycosylase D
MSREFKNAAPVLKVAAEVSPGAWVNFKFDKSFKIGRVKNCDLCVDNSFVSRAHAEVLLDQGQWSIHDLGSANGLYVHGERVPSLPIVGQTAVRLGIEGPELKFELETAAPAAAAQKKLRMKDASIAGYIDHYFSKRSVNEPVGEHTMFIREAFAHVESKRKRRFTLVIATLVAVIVACGILAYYQHQQLQQQRASAKQLFYAIKAQDIDLANLGRALASANNPVGNEELDRFRARRQAMEQNYDNYLATLHIYDPKLTERQRLIMRVARIFGECELDMPADFEAEINRYIERWRASGRLKTAILTAQQKGYTDTISRDLLARGLPPQFFYLALQESGFNTFAVGPATRKGFAKGMWQFIPETAVKYNLHLGPLVDQSRPDPADDRHNFKKETEAATLYLQDLYGTDAQASGFLVMACYNWGENQVLPLIQSMPANPRERNFWMLLSKARNRIPKETYDYVFYIASAAVIGENPRLFGFDFDNPLITPDAKSPVSR